MSGTTPPLVVPTVTAPVINDSHTFKAGTIMINGQAYDVMATFIREGQSIQVTPEILANQTRMAKINTLAREKLQPMVNKDTFKDKEITIIDGKGAKIDEDSSHDIPHVQETKALWNDYKAKLYDACFTPLEQETNLHLSTRPSRVDYTTPQLTIQGSVNQSSGVRTTGICSATAANFLDRVLALGSISELGETPSQVVDDITLTGADKHTSIVVGRPATHATRDDPTLSGEEVAFYFSDTLLNQAQSWRQPNTPIVTGIPARDIQQFSAIFTALIKPNQPNTGTTVTVNGLTFGIAVLKQASGQHEFLIYDSHGLRTAEVGQRGPAFLRKFATPQEAATFIVSDMISAGISISDHSTDNSLSLESLKSGITSRSDELEIERVYQKVYNAVMAHNTSVVSDAQIEMDLDGTGEAVNRRWAEVHALDDNVRPFFRAALLDEDAHKARDRIALDVYSRFPANLTQLQREFDYLQKTNQDTVDGIVYGLAGEPEDSSGHWGRNHRTDNVEFFRKALTTVYNKFVLHQDPQYVFQTI